MFKLCGPRSIVKSFKSAGSPLTINGPVAHLSSLTPSHVPLHYSLGSDLPGVAFKTRLLLKGGPFRRKCHVALQGGLRAGLRKVAEKMVKCRETRGRSTQIPKDMTTCGVYRARRLAQGRARTELSVHSSPKEERLFRRGITPTQRPGVGWMNRALG